MLVTILFAGCATPSDNGQAESSSLTPTTTLLTSADKTTDASSAAAKISYPVVDTSQGTCYNDSAKISCPAEGKAFYGQDAQYTGNVPNYTDNRDGTITDEVTGLVWAQNLSGSSMVWEEADDYCESLELAGYDDWRLPSLKELWSIRDFSAGWPWVDTDYFYLVGNGSEGAQQHSWSSNYYLVDTEEAVKNVAFAVNDWTGHIKAFDGRRFVRAVRGDTYGINDFVDNGDCTITDEATGLMWAQDDSGMAIDWKTALAYAENSTYAGYDDWRLPNVKELQSIVDYSGVFPAIDSTMFNISEITNEAGNADYPFFWTSTSNPYIDQRNDEGNGYCYAWYVAFGYAVDHDGNDSHGAGAVRFDTKSEEGIDGPDGERYYNYVRLVRGGDVIETPDGDPTTVNPDRVVAFDDGDTGMAPGQGGPGGQQAGPGGQQAGPGGQQAGPGGQQAGPGGQQAGPSGQQAGPGGQQAGPGGQQAGPDLAAAAAKLGITEDVLKAALGDPGQGQPDFAAAATKLGITKAELMAALGTTQH